MGVDMRTIHAGDTVRLLPQWQDPGDAALHWIALEDEAGGHVRIAPINTGLSIAPQYVVRVDMLEGQP